MRYFADKSRRWAGRMVMTAAGVLCAAALFLGLKLDVQAETKGTVTAASANIRASADANSKALASVLKNNEVQIIEQVTGADGKVWYKVFIDANTTGYIRSDLVSKVDGEVPTGNGGTTTTATTTTTTTTINTNVQIVTDGSQAVQPVSASVKSDGVRVRSDASTNGAVVTKVNKDVALTVTATKTNGSGETWYLISCKINDADVAGYIRSDYVKLGGDLVPPEENAPETPPEEQPGDNVDVPQEPVPEVRDYETGKEEDVWYLYDHTANKKYQVSALISAAQQNADALADTQKKLSGQKKVVVFLIILIAILIMGIAFLVFKLKDLSDDDGFEDKAAQRNRARQPLARPSGQGGVRPSGQGGTRPAGQGGTRPAGQGGTRPAGQGGTRPAGQGGTRPAGQGGTRPAGQSGARPAGQGGTRPAGQGGTRPAEQSGARPSGQGAPRPAGQSAERAPQDGPQQPSAAERQAKADVEARDLEKKTTEDKSWQAKNFMSDDDKLEFEFLNWNGEEEKE